MTNTRSWIQYPIDLPLMTPIGEVELNVTDADHIFVTGRAVDVFNVEYNMSVHVYRQSDAVWSVKGHADVYGSRCETYGDLTPAAAKKIAQVVGRAVTEWSPGNEEVFAAAARANVNNAISGQQGTVDELQRELRKQQDKLHKLLADERTLA